MMNIYSLYYLTKDGDNIDLWQLGNPGVYVYVRRLRGKTHAEQWTCPIMQSARYEYVRNYTICKSYDLNELEGVAAMECLEPLNVNK